MPCILSPQPKKPTSCGDNDNKGDCLDLGADEGDCAWCQGGFMPPSCVDTGAAKWIPEFVAKCKLPKKHKKAADDAVEAEVRNWQRLQAVGADVMTCMQACVG
jgi:hypothetical protein